MENKKTNPVLSVVLFLIALGVIFALAISTLAPTSKGTGIISTSFSKDKIALIRVEGIILDSRKTIEQLKMWAEDDSVKAIIIRIVSPGGLVTPSQEIYNEIVRTRDIKPVWASMGSLAASGGYYIAAGCDKIVSSAGTITGSIGVIMAFSNTEKLMDWIGIKTLVVKSGKFKDTGSAHRAFTPEDEAIMQGIVDDTYDQFIGDIASGRNMDKEKVRKLADGRIYTGRQALGHGLVDKIGDLKDAIDFVANQVGITGEPEIVEDIEEPSWLRQIVGEEFDAMYPANLFRPSGAYYLWPAY